MTPEQFDKAYRDVWSSFPIANRLWRFAQAIAAIEREECAKVCISPPEMQFASGYLAQAIRARSEA